MADDDIVAEDLRPLGDLSPDDIAWVRRLHARARSGDLVVRFGAGHDDDTPIVWCAEDGTWWAGRYVGSVAFEGRRLRILPRVGLPVLAHWLAAANRISITPSSASLDKDESFLPALLAHVWLQTLVRAARHGNPYLRIERVHEGPYVRGRLDVHGTARLLQRQARKVASRDRDRTLNHDLSRVIIAAERTLNRTLCGGWISHNTRARDLLATLRTAVGARPRLPSKHDLNRIRYTPIRQPWEAVAELSYRIATSRGLMPSADSQDASGILVDVAELWELFVLQALRRGLPGHYVRHGTTELKEPLHLLRSEDRPDSGMGRLLPDFIIETGGRPSYVIDAKYKLLAPSAARRTGVQREDLYQLTAYMSHFAGQATSPPSGALVYPLWADQHTYAQASSEGPWRAPEGGRASFVSCPTDLPTAVSFVRDLVQEEDPDAYNWEQ